VGALLIIATNYHGVFCCYNKHFTRKESTNELESEKNKRCDKGIR